MSDQRSSKLHDQTREEMNPVFNEFIRLKKYIASRLGLPASSVIGKIASVYKDKAKQRNPTLSSLDILKLARGLVDNDTYSNLKSLYKIKLEEPRGYRNTAC